MAQAYFRLLRKMRSYSPHKARRMVAHIHLLRMAELPVAERQTRHPARRRPPQAWPTAWAHGGARARLPPASRGDAAEPDRRRRQITEIEGERVDRDQVPSSLALRLGMDIGAQTPGDRY